MKIFTNIVLWAFLFTTGSLIAQPTVAATTPPVRNAGDVISLFSDAYTNLAATDWFPNWGQSTVVTDVVIATNNTKKYTNFNYQGVQFANAVNASGMTKLHLDIWTPDCASFKVYPIVSGQPEQFVDLTPTFSGWNSFDIALSNYTIPLTSIIQFKFVGTTGSTVYLDNIYFWKPANIPTITGFTVPAKLVGDAAFTLTAPTSNSAGAFTYTSSNTNVATISGNTVTIVGGGTSIITANQAAAGAYSAGSTAATLVVTFPAPTVAAATPTAAAAGVISLFSNAYTDVAGTDWFPNWGQSTVVTDVMIAGNATKKYDNLNYQGVQFAAPINATGKTHLHIDVWTPNCTSFTVSLINIAPLAQKEQAVILTPTLSGWNSFDIPLASYNTIALSGIGQFKLEGLPAGSTVYLDNIYFYSPPITAPTVAAATPTRAAASVISLFSNAYTDVAGTDWFPNWGQTTVVTDVMIAGNATKKYTNLNYQGVQFATPINATGKTHLHIDLWTANCTSFKVSLINVPPLTQTEQAVTLTPTLLGWNSFDIPLSSYNTIALSGIGQFKLEGLPAGSAVYLDNIYFYTAPPTAPTTAAPTPTAAAAGVISLFSNAYTDVAGTDWFPNWGQTTVVTDVMIAGNATKKYDNLNYQGVQFANPINATGKTHLHIDLWTPNCTSFKVSLINVAPLAQKEQTVTLTPTLSGWNSFDIPLASYNTIVLSGIGQIKLEGLPAGSTVYLDNIYFYSPPTAPTTAAPTPTRIAANVTSLFSNAYTDVAGTDWFPNWGQSTVVTEVMIAGNATKKYDNLNYQGVQFANPINATGKTHLHVDLWTPNCTSFTVSLINIAPLAQKEQAVTLTPSLFGWNSFDIPLTSYNTIVLSGIGQLKLEGLPAGSTVYLDNIYFYNATIPVELTFVKAKTVTTTTVLNWQTASEQDNQGFAVERGSNGIDFVAIGQVKGNGTTAAIHDYTFTDATPSVGVNYYRLRQVDGNGKEKVSKVVSVVQGKNILVLKNTLVHDVLDVTVGETSKTPLSIFNVSGQLVYATTIQGNQQVNLSALTSGLYIIRTATGEVSRFVKD